MTRKNSKIRIVLTFAAMLAMAMLLQSIVNVFLGLRSSVREDIHWSRLYLDNSFPARVPIEAPIEDIGDMKELIHVSLLNVDTTKVFSCVSVEIDKQNISVQGDCRYSEDIRILAGQAREYKQERTDFAGTGWHSLFSMSEMLLVSVPLLDTNGQVIGTITAERSLLPIYSRFRQDFRILLGYLAVNALLFTILFFVRIQNMFFRPLERLVEKADSYHQDEHHFALLSDDESPFRKLSSKLNTLLARIESDNRTLRQHVRELEQVNAELTAKNDLILRSEKLASVGRLSAGLAHEIGNPLSIIQGYVELLGRDDLSGDEKCQFSSKAQQELDRIKRLIRQLLDFAGPVNLVTERVPVDDLIMDVLAFVSLEKSLAKCAISTRLEADNSNISGNKDALRQVLINCLLNAGDATGGLEESRRQIHISTAVNNEDPGKPMAVISIRDNGVGIPEEQLVQVFDPFYTTKEVGRGTGLGLFVSHAIVEKCGGAICLTNVAPVGAEVTITLPLSVDANETQQ